MQKFNRMFTFYPFSASSAVALKIRRVTITLCVGLLPSGLLAHSGGLNSQGCHSGSQPYHCHRSDNWNTPSAFNEIIRGTVTKVRDGDTFVVGDQPIRLAAVDCPESDTQEGQRVTTFLGPLILSKRVTCELTGTQTYDRLVAYCTINGRDLGELLFESTQCQVWERYDVWGWYLAGKVVGSIAARSFTCSESRQNLTDSCLERTEATIRRALGAKDAVHG